eukprot:TRINITY_DN11306_c0_g1_i1.p1 TRINITY_DN11306_c0_g1~~TRINITY_DN11306_c0_g1_i1.p1  ORF type:complete len:270 (+),score=84.56 TRINITY_DN11306_c0_g1_i1:188-997(+)
MAFLLKNIKSVSTLSKRTPIKNNRGAAYVSPGTILKKMVPNVDVSKIKVPQVPMRSEAASYATALYALTRNGEDEELVEADMESLSSLFNSSMGKQLNYVLKTGESADVLAEIATDLQSEQTREFFEFLGSENKLGLVPEISQLYNRIGEEARGEVAATITLAKLPTREFLVEKVAQATFMAHGAPVSLNVQIDPSIGLGYKIQVGDHLFDASAELFLASLTNSLDDFEREYKTEASSGSSELNTLPTKKSPPPTLNLPPFLGLGKDEL